jgi:peptidyl-Lys metalloendopeptidase
MKNHRLLLVVTITLLAALLISSSAGAAPKDDLLVSLSAAQSKFKSSQDVMVTVTISNPTQHSTRLLKWFTPDNQFGLEEPVFIVKVNGTPVSYTGAIYKRPAATGNDYITLKAGQSIVYNVNLGDYYDLSVSGQYEIFYYAASFILYDDKTNGFQGQDTLTSGVINFKVDGRIPKGKPTPPPTPPPGGNAFDACTATQQAILIDSRAQAQTYASESEGYLEPLNTATTRYGEWFGLFTPLRYDTVSSHFTKLHNAWDNAGVTFHCGCKQNVYAYVYPDRPYHIYLCKVFWQAPLAGTDSKGGTLIHEMSHFYVVASTTDYVYGQTGARALAISDPDKAIMNADNHEYFSENNPYLP